MNIESIAVGVTFTCDCNNGRIVKIESAGKDYKLWCQCGAKFIATITGRVFKPKTHSNAH